MSDEMFKWAAAYASRGWPPVVCHGENDGKCTCRSANCQTPGKHPLLTAWQKRPIMDEDELSEWFDGSARRNLGVQLGQRSGIIDIEYDTEEGKKSASRFGLDNILTPTFTSRRSTHRILKWDSRLPEQAVYKYLGLEIRIGGGGNGAQSIFPPSMHASGVSYSWVPGMSPEECEVAEIPHDLLVAIVNQVEATGGEKKDPANMILRKEMGEGDRHHALVRYCARACINMVNVHDEIEQQDVLMALRGVNLLRCKPPKPEEEITNIFMHELKWATKKRAEGVMSPEERGAAVAKRMANGTEEPKDESPGANCPFTLLGLERRDDGWYPGKWQLKVIHSDPVTFVLTVPVHRDFKPTGSETTVSKTVYVSVTMDAETYRSAAKVAQAILEATHTVVVDGVPEDWYEKWNGSAAKKDRPACRGLKGRLMDVAVQEAATPENCRFAAVAGWLQEVLSMAPRPDQDDEESGSPDVTGMPAWVRDKSGRWELWFAWTKVWEMVDRGRRRLESGDILKIKKMILAGVKATKLPDGRAPGENGSSRRYIRFGDEHLAVVERLASGDFGAEEETAFSIYAKSENEFQKSDGNVETW